MKYKNARSKLAMSNNEETNSPIKEKKLSSGKEALYSWKSFPFIEFPFQSVLLILFFILCSIFVSSLTRNVFWILFSNAILIGSLFPYFVITKYTFFNDHLKVKYFLFTRERKYSEFKCFYADKKGIMLGTFAKPRGLDRFRGQSIRFTKKQTEKDEILDFFQKKIGNKY